MINVTDIYKNISRYPELEQFLQKTTNNAVLETNYLYKSFNYPSEIVANRQYNYYGMFIDYFIRRCISEFKKEQFHDRRVNGLKNDYGEHLDSRVIENVENMQNDTFNILEDLTIYSSYHFLCFREGALERPFNHYNLQYLNCIKNYIKNSFDFEKYILLNPVLGCKYFKADCDIIYNGIIIDIKNSKFISKTKADFYQHLLYSFGYYDKTRRSIKKFKIYNPLLGLEYDLELNAQIDFNEFQKILIKDVFKKTIQLFRIFPESHECEEDSQQGLENLVQAELEKVEKQANEELAIFRDLQDENSELCKEFQTDLSHEDFRKYKL